MSSNIETDPLFTLLTDALRAGPGSPQWRDALAAVRARGMEGSDEHKLLMEAREALESGRDYRAVRAGPGFTRKLMSEIEHEQAGKPGGVPTATIVLIICGLLIMSGAAFLIYHAFTHENSVPQQIDDLYTKSGTFLETLGSATFDSAISDGWETIGRLHLDAKHGLRPAGDADQENKNLGGGVCLKAPVAGTTPFAVDVSAHAEASSALLLEAFVSTDNKFSDKGTSSKDLVWQLAGTQQKVLLSGSGKPLANPPAFQNGDTVRLIVGENVAIVEVSRAGGKPQRLWAGAHELGTGPRYVGVRFLQTGPSGQQQVSVQQIKITTAAK